MLADDLLEKIRSRQALVGVIGLGYVGLPLAVEFAHAGFSVTGIDIDASKVALINRGESYIPDVLSDALRTVAPAPALLEAGTRSALGVSLPSQSEPEPEMAPSPGRLSATTDFSALASLDSVNICVPTPLRKTRDPDLSYVVAVVEQIAPRLHPGMLVILESTTYPGTTTELVKPLLEATGLRAGEDFFLAFSPERVDPGNPQYKTQNIPRVVGGINPRSTELASALYRSIVEQVVPVSSTQVAELVKLLENTFRAVNIGLVNEIALMCHALGVDVWEVIEAAKTKPFGFMPFYPGPGLGGHCIPVDPFYLSWKARQSGFECRFIELAGHVNAAMPAYVVERVVEALNSVGKATNGARIHLFGVAYKRNVGDLRESPALDILDLLVRRGAEVTYTDPYVPRLQHGAHRFVSIAEEEAFRSLPDCAVICTDHSAFDYAEMVRRLTLIVDTRNALRDYPSPTIFRL